MSHEFILLKFDAGHAGPDKVKGEKEKGMCVGGRQSNTQATENTLELNMLLYLLVLATSKDGLRVRTWIEG